MAKYGVQWPQILSDTQTNLIDTFNVTSFPTSVLIDPDGKVIGRDLRGDQLKEKLTQLSK